MSRIKFTILYVCITLQIALLTCCHNKSEVILGLETADSLLSADCDSLAAMVFYQMDTPEDTIAELPFYNYILSRISCRNYEYLEPEILDLPIAYFKKSGDLKRLAYAYCYKSIFLLNSSLDMSSAMIYNKMAEELVKNFDDDILRYNIFSTGYTLLPDVSTRKNVFRMQCKPIPPVKNFATIVVWHILPIILQCVTTN